MDGKRGSCNILCYYLLLLYITSCIFVEFNVNAMHEERWEVSNTFFMVNNNNNCKDCPLKFLLTMFHHILDIMGL